MPYRIHKKLLEKVSSKKGGNATKNSLLRSVGVLGVTSRIALLLIAMLFFGINSFAAPQVFPGGPYSSFRNINIDLNGYATDSQGIITSISWIAPAGCTKLDEFVYVSGVQNKCDAVIICTNILTDNVSLKADNNNSETTIQNAAISISNRAPSATLDANNTSGLAPLTVTFTGFCSDLDGTADISSCKIKFEDGLPAIDFVLVASHAYSSAGIFYATLTATDAQTTDINSILITVSAPAAPTIGSKKPANGSYTNVVKPTVSFDVNGSASSVNLSKLALFIDGSLVTPNTPIQFGNNYFVSWPYGSDLPNSHNAKIGVRAFDNLGNYSDANWSFTVDTAPPSSASISFGSGWTTNETPAFSLSASDSGSGMGSGAEMILSCTDSRPAGSAPYSTQYSGFNITTGPGCSTSDGSKTIYAWFKDAAGNWSSSTSTTVNYDNTKPGKPSAPSASAGNGQVSLSWSSMSDSGPSGISTYKIYVNGSYNTSTSGTSITISSLSNGSSYGFRISAVDLAGNESEMSDSISATPRSTDSSNDTTVPELFWELPANNSTVSGIVLLKVQAYDNESGLRFVSFKVDGVEIGTDYTALGERYTVDWNSETVVDGVHTLKATAKSFGSDEGTNSRTRDITVTTNNGITSLPGEEPEDSVEAQDAESALAAADDAKEEAAAMLADLRSIGFEPGESLMDALQAANNKLEEAQSEFDGEDYNAALGKADEATGLFDDFTESFSVGEYGNAVGYVYNREHIEVLLNGIGFSPELASEAEAMMDEISVDRELLVKEIVESGETFYRAIVRIAVKNDSGEAKEFKVIEIIPKEFAEIASLVSGNGFAVLAEDPVLEWSLSLAAGEEREILYALKENFSRESADNLLNADSLGKFAVPPVPLKQDTVVPESIFSQQAPVAGFFGLDAAGITGFAAVVIIIVAAALLLFNYLQGRNNGGQSGSGLASFGEGKKMGLFGSFGKKKEEPKKKRWAYKE